MPHCAFLCAVLSSLFAIVRRMRLSTPRPLRLVKVIILPPSPPSFSLRLGLSFLRCLSHKAALDLHFCQGNWSIWLLPHYNSAPPPSPYPCHATRLLLPTEPIFRSPTSRRPPRFRSLFLTKTSHFCRKVLHLGSRANLWL